MLGPKGVAQQPEGTFEERWRWVRAPYIGKAPFAMVPLMIPGVGEDCHLMESVKGKQLKQRTGFPRCYFTEEPVRTVTHGS